MISHNVQPTLNAIVKRFQGSNSISTEQQPMGDGAAWLAQSKFDEYSASIQALDGSLEPLDTDSGTHQVEVRQGAYTASCHAREAGTTFQFSGPGWVGYGQNGPQYLRYAEARSEGNTVIAEAYYQDHVNPEKSFQQHLEYTAKGALRRALAPSSPGSGRR